MVKPTGILDLDPATLDRPLTDDEKQEIEESKENLNWDAQSEEKPEDKKEPEKTVEKEEVVEIDEDAKAEETRLSEKAQELSKTVEEVKVIEEEEAIQETARIAKLAEEQSKTVEEITKQEADAKAIEDAKTPEAKETERLEAIAKEEGITVDEVREAEVKDAAVVEKYGSDPKQIARALRKENSAYGKLKSDNDKLVEYKKNVEVQQSRYNEQRVDAQLETNKEELVQQYIKLNPSESEENADVLFERAKVQVKDALKAKDTEADTQLQKESDTARDALVENIPEEYKEYSGEIRQVLNEEGNQTVMSKEFDILNLCHWARGKKMTPEYVKSLTDAAEKRGKEQSEILEKKSATVSTTDRSGEKPKKGDVVGSASAKDIDRALEMFSNKDDWTKEQKIAEYMNNRKGSDNWD